MANRLTTNPIYVDQFNADTILANEGQPFYVRRIRLRSVAQWDLFFLENMDGDILLRMENSLGGAATDEVDFGIDGFNFGNKGVRIDVSDCTGLIATNGTDAVWIYLA